MIFMKLRGMVNFPENRKQINLGESMRIVKYFQAIGQVDLSYCLSFENLEKVQYLTRSSRNLVSFLAFCTASFFVYIYYQWFSFRLHHLPFEFMLGLLALNVIVYFYHFGKYKYLAYIHVNSQCDEELLQLQEQVGIHREQLEFYKQQIKDYEEYMKNSYNKTQHDTRGMEPPTVDTDYDETDYKTDETDNETDEEMSDKDKEMFLLIKDSFESLGGRDGQWWTVREIRQKKKGLRTRHDIERIKQGLDWLVSLGHLQSDVSEGTVRYRLKPEF